MSDNIPEVKATPWLSSACIEDIFLHSQSKQRDKAVAKFGKSLRQSDDNYPEYLVIHRNMTEIRPRRKGFSPGGGGKKQKITRFSRKSRTNFIKMICMLDSHPELWQDFTFADDIMQGMSIEERRDISNKALNRFRRMIKKRYPDLWAIYKREWQTRKSGNLSGEYIPHFHMFFAVHNRPEDFDYISLALDLASLWVQSTKTEELEKALSVARHPNSYRLIESRKQAMIYASKYVGKIDDFKDQGSIGRSWGTIGTIIKGNPLVLNITAEEAVHIRRLLRRKTKGNRNMQKRLSNPEVPTFVIVQEDTMERIMKFVGDTLEWECRSFFAGVA